MEAVKIIAAGSAAVLGGYMSLIEPQKLQVRRLALEFPTLPPAFDGYKILHLSDLHTNRIGRLERRLMRVISAEPVDACVVTGDVTAKMDAAGCLKKICSVVDRRGPVFMVPGNSEHKPWVDSAGLLQMTAFEGLRILINSSAVVTRGTDSIRIVGVDDPYSHLADVDAAFRGVDPNEFVVFLTHCPSTAPEGISRGADLILAGHTHGGQVRLPFVGMVWSHMRRHRSLNDGLYTAQDLSRVLGRDAGDSALFVSRGIGTSRLPIRLSCPPEVVYITLRRRRV